MSTTSWFLVFAESYLKITILQNLGGTISFHTLGYVISYCFFTCVYWLFFISFFTWFAVFLALPFNGRKAFYYYQLKCMRALSALHFLVLLARVKGNVLISLTEYVFSWFIKCSVQFFYIHCCHYSCCFVHMTVAVIFFQYAIWIIGFRSWLISSWRFLRLMIPSTVQILITSVQFVVL
jgi:hypothetical protein